MAEGHTIHRIALHQQELVGRRLEASSPQGRFAEGAAALDGCTLEGIDAHGKHLHHRYGMQGVHVHLGMFGKWLRLQPAPEPRPQVRLRLSADGIAWDLIGPTICELIDAERWDRVVASLGPDPLRDDADPDEAWRPLHRFRGAVGAAIMDQSVVAGIGNVLRAETLFLTGIHPERPALSLTRSEFDAWWSIALNVMRRAVEDGRILTAPVPDELRAAIPQDDARWVYSQAHCRRCGTPVATGLVGGRKFYACPRCQPLSV